MALCADIVNAQNQAELASGAGAPNGAANDKQMHAHGEAYFTASEWQADNDKNDFAKGGGISW